MIMRPVQSRPQISVIHYLSMALLR